MEPKKQIVLLLSMALLLVTACGGASASGSGSNSASKAPPATPEQLTARQDAVCDRYCAKQTSCAAEGGMATKLKTPEARADHSKICSAKCVGRELPQKAINATGTCLRTKKDCAALASCLMSSGIMTTKPAAPAEPADDKAATK